MFYQARTTNYHNLLPKPKAAKAVASWFMETDLLPYLTPAHKLASKGRRWNGAPEEGL